MRPALVHKNMKLVERMGSSLSLRLMISLVGMVTRPLLEQREKHAACHLHCAEMPEIDTSSTGLLAADARHAYPLRMDMTMDNRIPIYDDVVAILKVVSSWLLLCHHQHHQLPGGRGQNQY